MANKFSRSRSIGQVRTKSFEDIPYVRDVVEMIELGDDYKEVRILPGSATTAGVHYLPLWNKDGEPVMSKFNKKEQATKPVFCLAWDFETQQPDPDKDCPYCDARLPLREETYVEVIDREAVEQEPSKHKPSKEEKASGVKDKENSGSWTPVRVWRLTNSLIKEIQKLENLNKHKDEDGNKVAMGVDDEEFGCDIYVSFDNGRNVAPTDRYSLQKGDVTPLEEHEADYLVWDVGAVIANKCTPSLETATRDVERYNKFAEGEDADDSDDSDDDYNPEKGDYVSVVLDSGEEYEGTVTKNTSKALTIETDDDEVTISWVDVEECEPAKKQKKASKAKPAKSSKGKRFEDDEDDDDEAPWNSKSKSKSKSRDDDDDEDDDEEEKPKSKAKAAKPAKGKRFDDDDDDDDDDEEEKPKSKAKAAKPAKGKRRYDFDDDDDDE